MMDLSIAGQRCIKLALSVPRTGVWTAVAELDGLEAPSGKVTMVLGGREWSGTVVASGVVGGRVDVQIVGGAGGFASVVPPRDYANVPIRVPMLDALQAAGERLSPTSDQPALDSVLARWTSRQGTLGQAVDALLNGHDVTWRVLPDGSVWVGADRWVEWAPTGGQLVTLVSEDPVTGTATYGADELTMLPGMSYRGRHIAHVQYHLESGHSRVELLTEPAAPDAGMSSLIRYVVAIVRKLFGSRLDYLAFYGCKVLEQTGDTLSLMPDDPRLPEMSGVPIRGLPGVEVKVKSGARCMVGFDGGNPSQRYACQFEPNALDEITITASGRVVINSSDIQLGDGAGNDIARVGDAIMIQIPPPIGLPIMGQIMSGSRNARA